MGTHLDFAKGITLGTSFNRLIDISTSGFRPARSCEAYHLDSSSKSALVGEGEGLEAGELSKAGV